MSGRVPRPRRAALVAYTTLFRSRKRVKGEFIEARDNVKTFPNLRKAEMVRGQEATTATRYMLSAADVVTQELKLPSDRKSTRLNSSHLVISYAVFCLKKKKILRQ